MSNNEKKGENRQGNAEGLPKIETQEALVRKIQDNPGLPLDQIINRNDFTSLFPNVNYLKRFQARFPQYLKFVIEHIFANDAHFSRIFARHIHLIIFTEEPFAIYIDRLIEHLLTNATDFARLFTSDRQFLKFVNASSYNPLKVASSSSFTTGSSQDQTPVRETKREVERDLSILHHPVEPFNTGSSSKSEEKGPEGREVKKQSRADIPPDRDHFSGVFSRTKVGVSAALTGLLDGTSLRNLSQMNRGARAVYGEAAYEMLIKEEIGPDPKLLILSGETAQAAYHRHRDIIRSLPLINTQEELQKIRVTYPSYYFNRVNVVGNVDIRGLFSDFKEAPKLKTFYEAFPAYADRVVECLLIDDEFFIFVIHEWYAVSIFLRAFPRYASRVMERMLTDEVHFANVFGHMNALIGFCDEVPSEYANKVAEHILASDALFSRVFFSLAPDCGLPMFRERFPAYADRAEALFRTKQQQTKNVTLPAGRSINQVVSSSSTPSYSPSMFASSSSVTTGSPQGQPAVREAKGEANAVGLPTDDNGEASTQTSFGSLGVNLPTGDDTEDEDPDRSPPSSPRGS
jgi:hypothetical protein